MQTVIETPTFSRRADALLNKEERENLVSYLAANPEAGKVIKGSGGVRKLRFGAKGHGKSGGVRVIYYVLDETLPILALLIYGKGEQEDLEPEELKAVAQLAANMKAGRKLRAG